MENNGHPGREPEEKRSSSARADDQQIEEANDTIPDGVDISIEGDDSEEGSLEYDDIDELAEDDDEPETDEENADSEEGASQKGL